MKAIVLFGAILALVGLIAFAMPSFNTEETKDVVKLGDLKVQARTEEPHFIPPIVSGGAMVLGVLLIGAGLMLRSLSALWRVNSGFNPGHAITFNLSMPSSAATTSAETRARLRQFGDKMQSIPGVQAVSVTLGSRPMTRSKVCLPTAGSVIPESVNLPMSAGIP